MKTIISKRFNQPFKLITRKNLVPDINSIIYTKASSHSHQPYTKCHPIQSSPPMWRTSPSTSRSRAALVGRSVVQVPPPHRIKLFPPDLASAGMTTTNHQPRTALFARTNHFLFVFGLPNFQRAKYNATRPSHQTLKVLINRVQDFCTNTSFCCIRRQRRLCRKRRRTDTKGKKGLQPAQTAKRNRKTKPDCSVPFARISI